MDSLPQHPRGLHMLTDCHLPDVGKLQGTGHEEGMRLQASGPIPEGLEAMRNFGLLRTCPWPCIHCPAALHPRFKVRQTKHATKTPLHASTPSRLSPCQLICDNCNGCTEPFNGHCSPHLCRASGKVLIESYTACMYSREPKQLTADNS